MVDDVKAQVAEVLRSVRLDGLSILSGEAASMLTDALAEADLLADGQRWEPLDGHDIVWCDRKLTVYEGAVHAAITPTCPGPHRRLAVEASAPTPRYTQLVRIIEEALDDPDTTWDVLWHEVFHDDGTPRFEGFHELGPRDV